MSKESQQFMEAFEYSMSGCGMQIALGPLRILYRDSKWTESCKIAQRFADSYVDQALRHRQQNYVDQENGEDQPGRHTLLRGMAEQTNDRNVLRSQVLQALMAAQETTAALISNVFFLLSKHPDVWDTLRQEARHLEAHELNLDSLQRLQYLRKILNESKRRDLK